jgi:hypothetical protein
MYRQKKKQAERNKGGQTTVRSAKLTVAFRNLTKGPKNNFGSAQLLCKKHLLKVVKLVILHKHMFLSFIVTILKLILAI